MARVLFISKPIAPPWNDSGKNLVKDLALSMRRHEPTVMTHDGDAALEGRVGTLPVYPAAAGGFAPALIDQARVFAALFRDGKHPLWHFFFAPNPKSCLAGGLAKRVRRRPCVHTVSSSPRSPADIVPKLFADVHVVLSAHTEGRLVEAGLSPERIARIAPCIQPLPAAEPLARRRARQSFELPDDVPVVVYPGDLEFGEGGELCVRALEALDRRDVLLVMACRTKTAAASEAERALRDSVRSRGLESRVRWIGETRAIHELLAAADVVALPSADLYAKMDYPLVLLEAMSLERPVVVARDSAAEELTHGGGALAVETSVEALAWAWTRLLDDTDRAAELGKQGRRDVLQRFSPQAVARAYEDVYDRLLG